MRKLLFSSLLLACSAAAFAAAPIRILVDAREASRHILHSRMQMEAKPGPFTLYFPKWIPGEHMPSGPLKDMAGFTVSANGAALPWRRDLLDMNALHFEVPAGASELEVHLDFLMPQGGAFSAGSSASETLVILSWNQALVYPDDGRAASEIPMQASVQLPAGWKYATALKTEHAADGRIDFAPVSLEKLIDSPVAAGRYLSALDITPAGAVPHHLNLISDSAAAIDIKPELIEKHRRLVREMLALFGARHYDHYDFLFTLSDQVEHFGLEHHESSDDRLDEKALTDDDHLKSGASLLPHEMFHSWNGKYRRPAGLATPDYKKPYETDLLWVYEGLTDYYGYVLAARSGLETPELFRGEYAAFTSHLDLSPGRQWRPLQDTADEAQQLYLSDNGWSSWRRGTDFYEEMALVWLEVDGIIRKESGGKKSLDDFCRLFHGGTDSGPQVKPYTADEVFSTLNRVQPYDWKKLLSERLNALGNHAPMRGLEMSGWRLAYGDTPDEYTKAREAAHKFHNHMASLGFSTDEEGRMGDVLPGSPAAKAGLSPGQTLIAVNGRKYSNELLVQALKDAKTSGTLELLTRSGEFFRTFTLQYKDGPRYPRLEPIPGAPDLLSRIIAPRAAVK